jgi:dTDP-4-amino-4,6-dideoxygalactose transaminase
VGVGNGLDAITLTLRAFGIGPGDGVIVPSHTFAGTWVGVAAAGATPVPAEIDPVTYTLDPAAAVAAIRPGVKAIMPVSLYGHPADMGALMAIAKQHELVLIEDGAQGHGAAAQGRRVGGLAHATAFSFYPTKNLGAIGEAGAVTTDDPEIDRRLRMLRNYGQQQRYVHETVGVNSRLDELQAAFLRVQLARLEAGNDARRALAALLKVPVEDSAGLGRVLIDIFDKTVEHKLLAPTFITEYPAEVSPLARRSDTDPFVTDRFELMIAGREIANGFSELNDSEDQAERFLA